MLAPPATGPTNYVFVPDNCVVVHLRKNVDTLKMWFLEWKYERQYGVPFDVSPSRTPIQLNADARHYVNQTSFF